MKRLLYLGTDPIPSFPEYTVIAYPVITIVPVSIDSSLEERITEMARSCTLSCFTGKNTVRVLFDRLPELAELLRDRCVSIGPGTTDALRRYGIEPCWQAKEFSQEGLMEGFSEYADRGCRIFYPRSALARPDLFRYWEERGVVCDSVIVYDTVSQKPLPVIDLAEVEEVFFTSPSTVRGFFAIYPEIPPNVIVRFQGRVTEKEFYRVRGGSI